MFQEFTYDQMLVLEALIKHARWQEKPRIDERFKPILEDLDKLVNNELYERDERHWNDK